MSRIQHPKSINNKQCISKCHKEGEFFIHPLKLNEIIVPDQQVCAIVPYVDDDGNTQTFDTCIRNNGDNDTVSELEDNISILYPIINFSPEIFLETYYDIKNITDFYSWLESNENNSTFTQLRVIDCLIMLYWNKINLFEEQFAFTIVNIIKKFWIKLMYKKLCVYVGVVENDKNINVIRVKPSENKLKKTQFVKERTKYITSEITNIKNIFIISNEYLDYLKEDKKIVAGIQNFYDFLLTRLEEKLQENKI